jgi:hypothetical protein
MLQLTIGLAHVVPNPLVPRNAAGQPVFPSIDVNTVKIAEVRTLLSDYFDQCWGEQLNVHFIAAIKYDVANRAVGGRATSIPWDKIVSDPAAYYDTEAFRMKLDHPQNLSAVQVLTLTQELLSTSLIDSPAPFCFLELEPLSPPPSILEHNNSAPPQSSTIQPPKSESGPTGPLDTGHEWKIVDPELSERPSPVFGSSPISQRDGSNTPPPMQPLCSPSPLPTPPSRQKGVKRKAKKEPE